MKVVAHTLRGMFSNIAFYYSTESLRVYSLKGSSSCKYDEIPCFALFIEILDYRFGNDAFDNDENIIITNY